MHIQGQGFGHLRSCILIFLLFENDVGLCLKLTNFEVPSHAEFGSSVTLTCEFDVGSATLNSVKWYKDEHEFFRFIPSNHLSDTQIFPLTGITLDKSISDQNHVTMMHLSFNSSGAYRCEVSTDLPDFKIAYQSKNLTVISSPKWGPNITGLLPYYSVGQTITGNCSVALSYPEPRITWHINGRKVGRHDYIVIIQKDGMLASAWSTLSYDSLPDDFQNNSKMEILCKVILGEMTVTERNAHFMSRILTKKSVQGSALQSLQSSGEAFAVDKINKLLALTSILVLHSAVW